ncbi:MAG: ester cyclase [Acidimicrobiia bacterium]
MADLKALAKRFNDEVMSKGNFDTIDEIVAEDFVEHQELPPGVPPGRAGLHAFVKMFRDAFPDLKVETVSAVVEGDEVWMQSLLTGTHKGELAGVPATGKKVSVAMFDRVKVRDGKAVEHWGVADDMGMMTQLGVIPEMG